MVQGQQEQDRAQAPGNPNDPWSLASNAYDRDKFYTRATDGNGHDNTIAIKVSPALFGQLAHLVESRQVSAYRTKADVIRDAVIHRLVYLRERYPQGIDLADLEMEQKQAELDRLRVKRETWKKYLEDLDTELTSLIADNEFDEAEWVIENHGYNESMTPYYLMRLSEIMQKHRRAIKAAHQ